jgi:hypothetical protein
MYNRRLDVEMLERSTPFEGLFGVSAMTSAAVAEALHYR